MEGMTEATMMTTVATETTTTMDLPDTSSERADISTSYDELLQTVLWVPPKDPALNEDAQDGATTDGKVTSSARDQSENDCDRLQDDEVAEVEATESARDVKSRDVQSRDAQSRHAQSRIVQSRDVQLKDGHSTPEPVDEATRSKQPKSTLQDLVATDDFALEPPSFASVERNVFEKAEIFRKGVMGEMESMKDSLCRHHQSEIQRLKEAHGRQLASLNHQLSRQRDLNDTFSKTLARKEQTIANLLQCLAAEKEKDRLAKFFVSWREKYRDSDSYESPQLRMARKFHDVILRRRVWNAWTILTKLNARQKFEDRVKEETRQKLETMEKECDARMLTLQSSLRSARSELESLRAERESHEERVKAALMRGVCALNVETMSVFSGSGGGANSVKSSGSVDGSLNVSSIHTVNNGGSSTMASTARGGGDDPTADSNPTELFSRKETDISANLSSTRNISPSMIVRPPSKTQLDPLGYHNPRPNSVSSHHSNYKQQHSKSSSRSSYPNSATRQSCGVNPLGNVPKEKGAQIKTLPHNTIVIERHVDRS